MGKFCGSPLYRESVCNCHLATSWMPDLEKICEEDIIPHDTLTSTSASSSLHVYPSGEFPVSIVLNGTYIHTLPRTDPGGYRVSTLSPPWILPVPFLFHFLCLCCQCCFCHSLITPQSMECCGRHAPRAWCPSNQASHK